MQVITEVVINDFIAIIEHLLHMEILPSFQKNNSVIPNDKHFLCLLL